MFLGKVKGNIVATQKYETLTGYKLMLVQPITQELKPDGGLIVAVDTAQAGVGDLVYLVKGRDATLPIGGAPSDATIVGIVDVVQVKGNDYR